MTSFWRYNDSVVTTPCIRRGCTYNGVSRVNHWNENVIDDLTTKVRVGLLSVYSNLDHLQILLSKGVTQRSLWSFIWALFSVLEKWMEAEVIDILQWRYNEHVVVKSPASRLFAQAQIKGNIKAMCHWPLCGKFTGDRWTPNLVANFSEISNEIQTFSYVWKCRLTNSHLFVCLVLNMLTIYATIQTHGNLSPSPFYPCLLAGMSTRATHSPHPSETSCVAPDAKTRCEKINLVTSQSHWQSCSHGYSKSTLKKSMLIYKDRDF